PSLACAQVAAGVTAVSDFRLRGISLSDRRTAVSFSLASDQADGVYFGGSATVTNTSHEGLELLGHAEYLGYTHRGARGPAIDVGISRQDYRVYLERRYRVSYTQVYAGLIGDNVRAHVAWLPNYPRDGVDVIYADADAAIRPAPDWRVTAHVGVLNRLAGSYERDGPRHRVDLRAGLAREFERSEVELSWVAVSEKPRQHPEQARSGLVLSASVFF
ncbi:MAG TPA: TorF family putative porin, partial [Phenylobacterium sp.]|nr:TorF family putative porin [Phenylobacterium sp.]